MREFSPEFTRNASRVLLLALFGFSLWSISRVLFPAAEDVGEPASRRQPVMPYLRAAILVLPEQAHGGWPDDSSLSTIERTHCNAVLLRMPILLPSAGSGRLEYSNGSIDALSEAVRRLVALGLDVAVEPFFVDAHGLAFEPAPDGAHRDRFFTASKELLLALARAVGEGNGHVLSLPHTVLAAGDAEEQTALLAALREASPSQITVSAARGNMVSDTIWDAVDFITASLPGFPLPSLDAVDSTGWSAWRDLARRVHKPVVIASRSARGGNGLWWDTAVDRLLGWDASYRVARSATASDSVLLWLSVQPWTRGLAAELSVVLLPGITALFESIETREFENVLSKSETILRSTE